MLRRLIPAVTRAALLLALGMGPALAMTNEMNQQAVELQKQQNWSGLAALAAKALAADPKDAFAWFDSGLAADGLGRKADAIKAYETAMPLVPSYLQGSVMQLLAQDYLAAQQPDRIAALYEQLEVSNPQLALSLRSQYAAIIEKAMPTPAASLPEVSPTMLAALSQQLRASWRPDAIPVIVEVRDIGGEIGMQTIIDFYSPATRTGLSIVQSSSSQTQLPAENPNWGVAAIPANFLSLSIVAAALPKTVTIDHAFLLWQAADTSDPTNLVWQIGFKDAIGGALVVPAYIMSRDELDRLQAAAQQGNSDAEYRLARVLAVGIAGSVNREAAVAWLEKAAASGNLRAENELGQDYQFGLGVAANPQTAAGWYRKAAEAGNPVAQYNLALLYEIGLGVPQDWIEAQQWLLKAYQGGAPDALAELNAVREPALREQHAKEVAQRLQGTGGTKCYTFQHYNPATGQCDFGSAVFLHLLNVAAQ